MKKKLITPVITVFLFIGLAACSTKTETGVKMTESPAVADKAEAPSPAADSRAIADTAFDEFINRDFVTLSKRFSPEMKAATNAENLSRTVSPVLDSFGKLKSGRPEPHLIKAQGNDVYLYPAEFEKADMTVVVTINAAGQVGGIGLRPPQK